MQLSLERPESHNLQGAPGKRSRGVSFFLHPLTLVDIDYIALGMGQASLLPGVCQPFCLTRSAPSANSLRPATTKPFWATFRLSGVVLAFLGFRNNDGKMRLKLGDLLRVPISGRDQ
jgi:hypothetical protein